MDITKVDSIQQDLMKVEEHMLAQFMGNTSDLAGVITNLITNTGKRIRPTLTFLFGEMLETDKARTLDLAAAVEMLHTATLVHDDLLDGAELRRGATTINASWSPAAAVLAGDFVFAVAAKLAADTRSTAVMEMFATTLATIVNGEISYMFRNGSGPDRNAYYHWIEAKTASMFELATGSVALLSDADERIVGSSRQYGQSLGMAFQIVDDVLDFTGEQAILGKPVGHDLRQGVITLPVFHYLEICPDDPNLQAVISRNGHNELMINQLITSIQNSPAIESSLAEANRFVEQSLDALCELPDTPARKILEDMAINSVNRQK